MIWNEWSGLVIGLMTLVFVFEFGVGILNLSYRNRPLPKNVQSIFTKSNYIKAKAYFTENSHFRLVKATFNFILFIALFYGGFFPYIAQITAAITENLLVQTFLFFIALIVLNLLISLPFNYYRTFSIETRYGFNKTTKKLFFTDAVRQLFVSTILISLIGVLLHALYQTWGEGFVFVAWIALSLLLVLLFMLNTKVFIKLFNKLTPLPEGSLKNSIVALANQTGFRAKAIYTMDASKRSSKLNAFFSGLGPIREIALFDTLIAKLSERQILAVLAHEIGHAKHFDEVRMLLQQILIFGIYALVINVVVSNAALSQAFGFTTPFFAFGLILFSILINPLELVLDMPINYLSRKAEYAADAFAVKQGFKKEMVEALKILSTENFVNLTPHPLQVLLAYSHPTMSDRLAAIEKLKS